MDDYKPPRHPGIRIACMVAVIGAMFVVAVLVLFGSAVGETKQTCTEFENGSGSGWVCVYE